MNSALAICPVTLLSSCYGLTLDGAVHGGGAGMLPPGEAEGLGKGRLKAHGDPELRIPQKSNRAGLWGEW